MRDMPEGKASQDSYPFYVYSGLLTKGHRKKIGAAIWEFLWCIDRTTREVEEDGEMVGLVLGGKPITLAEIAEELGGDKSTVHRNIEKLEGEGYLFVLRAPYGLVLKVRNSKKRTSVAKMQQQSSKWESTVAKIQQPLQKYNARCENANSNKDEPSDLPDDLKIDDITRDPLQKCNDESSENQDEGMPTPRQGAVPAIVDPDADSGRSKISSADYKAQVIAKYIERRANGLDPTGYDLDAVEEIVKGRIPLRTVVRGIDKAFDEFKPRHAHHKIRALSYCVPIIFDLYDNEKERVAAIPETLREATAGQEEPAASSVSDDEYEALLASMRTTQGG
jgi:DNA-binding transcriptional regulator GbsR (MarR family)